VLIELAGPPGAGKSTVALLVSAVVRERGGIPRMTGDVARELASRGLLGRTASVVPATLRRRVLWTLYLLETTIAGWWMVVRTPPLLALLIRQRRRPDNAMVAARGVVRWFIRHAGTERLFRRRGRPGEVLIADEGYVHRTVQLFASVDGRATRTELLGYLRTVPPADLTMLVEASPSTCVERILQRGLWDRFASRPISDLESFVSNAGATATDAVAVAAELGHRVVVVANPGSVQPPTDSIRDALSGVVVDVRRFRPSWAPPTPGTLRHAVRRRVAEPLIDHDVLGPVLGSMDIGVEGRVHAFTTGRRSPIVNVETTIGRLVVKRYPPHWSEGSIRHEHAVLDRLAVVNFPAVRLVAGPDGSSVIVRPDGTYAVFRYAPGRTFAGRVLGARRKEAMWADLGELLARLHADLARFDPGHPHHLGRDPATGLARRDLEWSLRRLGEVRAQRLPADGGWVRERADALCGHLQRLDERLANHPLTTTVIHGDFGPHNVLFGVNGPVLHDFELSRTEWRLTEIAIIGARVDDDLARRALMSAYRHASDLPDREWDVLGDVVQWYLITSAVYALDRYLVRSDPTRLDLARVRVDLAEEMRSKGVESWMM
jgi:Ser/Thr protein kinase RdoA (MazF antagonist)/thymidylate kinase